MSRPRKAPKLREKTSNGTDYFVCDVYRPEGGRTTVNFGPVPADMGDVADVYAAFAKWVKLFQSNPHKCLAFKSPWEAIEQMVDPAGILSVGDLVDNYLKYAEQTFKLTRKGEVSPNYKRLTRGLRFMEAYRSWPVNNFGPDDLRAVRDRMLAYRYRRSGQKEDTEQLTRSSINGSIKEIRLMFTWGVGRRAVEPAVEQAMRTEVKPLRRGHPGARENRRRPKVTREEFDKVVAVVNPVVADMMRVLRFSVCRPSEVLVMRSMDIRRDDPNCWLYVPGSDIDEYGDHKTLGAGKNGQQRVIPITKMLQKVIQPYLDAAASPQAYLFSPKQAMQEMYDERFANRKTPTSCGNRPGTNRREHPMIRPGERYQLSSFLNAVQRGCDRTGVPSFTLYDLRRSSITDIDAAIGDSQATRLVGHADKATTDIYKLEKVQRVIEAAMEYEAAVGQAG